MVISEFLRHEYSDLYFNLKDWFDSLGVEITNQGESDRITWVNWTF